MTSYINFLDFIEGIDVPEDVSCEIILEEKQPLQEKKILDQMSTAATHLTTIASQRNKKHEQQGEINTMVVKELKNMNGYVDNVNENVDRVNEKVGK